MNRRSGIWLVCLVLVGGFHSADLLEAADLFAALDLQPMQPPMEAVSFTTEALDGKRVSLRDFRGRIVLLNFWASWCVPCRQEMPAMEELYQAFKDKKFVVVAVNVKESRADAAAFLNEMKVTYPILLDPKGEVSLLYGAWALPLTYLIDREGIILARAFGPRAWAGQEAKALINQLLRSS